jgi:hypothetical protein
VTVRVVLVRYRRSAWTFARPGRRQNRSGAQSWRREVCAQAEAESAVDPGGTRQGLHSLCNPMAARAIDETTGDRRFANATKPLTVSKSCAPPGPVPFLLLRPDMCRFPLSSPERGSVSAAMVCCAAPIAQPGASYCRRHETLTRSRTSSSPSPFSLSPLRLDKLTE